MKEYLGTALGLGLGTLVYESLRGNLDADAWYRAGFAIVTSFVLLAILMPFTRRRRPPSSR
jgi:hypothetical protein